MTRTKNPLSTAIWAMVSVGLMGMVPMASADLDLSVCQSTCSAVPQDLWPYCCETHHTCCEQFADSCINDCLPRVNSGDVSAVEERPGLCCALYNLCCFRETLKVSNRNDGGFNQNIPFTHRFSTLPGGPMKGRRSQVVPRHTTQEAAPTPPSFTQSRVNDDNRQQSFLDRPKPKRNFQSSFRPNTRREFQTNSNIQNADNTLNQQFDVAPAPDVPALYSSDRPQAREEDSKPFRPQLSTRPSKLIRLTRPEKLTPASESRDVVFPEVVEPTERPEDLRTPKALDQSRPIEKVRPGSVFRPTNPRKVNEPEPTTDDAEPKTEERPKPGRPSFRPLQPRPLTQSKSNEPGPTDANPTQTKSADRIRPNLLIRAGGNREVTEAPEPATTPEDTQKEPKLFRPKIKVFRPGKKDSTDSDSALQSEKVPDQEVADSILNQQTVNKEVSAGLLKSNNVESEPKKLPTVQNNDQTSSAEPAGKGRVAPIRRIKLIRNREPNKSVQSQKSGEATRESETPKLQQTTTVAPKTRIQASSGRTRVTPNTQEVTTFRPRVTPGRTTGSTQAAQQRSREQTRVTQQTSGSRTRGRTRESSQTQTTQEPSRGRSTATRGRSRSRSRVTPEPTATENPNEPIVKEILKQESVKIQAPTTENTKPVEAMETSTEPLLPEVEVGSTVKPIEGEGKKTSESEQTAPTDIKEVDIDATAEATPDLKDQAMKKTTLLKPHVPSEQEKEEEGNANTPEEISPTEQPLTTKEVTDKPLAFPQSKEPEPSPRPSLQPQEASRLSPSTQGSASQRPTPQAVSRQRSSTQAASRQTSTTQAASRQRSGTQAASRRRSDSTSTQTTSRSRSRGRLSARQQLAVANGDSQP